MWGGRKEYEHAQERGKRKGNRKHSHSITQEDLWALQKVLSGRKGSLSATYKKNTETNTEVYDLSQKTMQALDRMASEDATFVGQHGKREH